MSRTDRRSFVTPLLCFFVALVEGYDLQSAGLAAPKLAPAFGLTTSELGLVFSSSTLGLFLGAIVGGRLSDLVGRKRLMVASLLMFGAFSIATALVRDVPLLLAARFLTGIGLGGAFPTLIGILAASGEPRTQATRVTMVAAGIPLGGATAGLLVTAMPGLDWPTIFHVGGLAPILLAVLVALFMREPSETAGVAAPTAPATPASISEVLFGDRRAVATVALWVGSFGTLLVLYLLLNWLPTLMIARGLGPREALTAASGFSAAGAIGTLLLGWLVGHVPRRPMLGCIYGGIAVSLVGLATGAATPVAAAALAGFFVVGAQFVLYGLSAEPYPPAMQGTGAGAAVAAGRLGALAGPLIAGFILAAGGTAVQILVLLLPVTGLAFLATLPISRSGRATVGVGEHKVFARS